MLDKKLRIVIPKEFYVLNPNNEEVKEVYFYYAVKEKLFYMLYTEEKKQYFITSRKADSKRRVFLPKEIVEVYKTKNIMIARKDKKLYLIPLKED